MYYAPHRLYKVTETEKRDELNRIISSGKESAYVCNCRCDDNTTEKFTDENGRVYTPKHKIVSQRADITEGDYVQCLDENGNVVGEGRVFNAPRCNYLDYMTIYV